MARAAEHRPAISDYGFLSDCSSCALVSTDCSVDWWCLPRFDSPSVFGRLLDPSGGHWRLAPRNSFTCERAYLNDSLVLRSVLRTSSGAVAVTDALTLQPGSRGHDIGLDPPRVLVRCVEGIEGEVHMDVEVSPRLEYALTTPRWQRGDGESWTVRAGPMGLRLDTEVSLQAQDGDLRGGFRISAGDRVTFSLAYAPPYEPVGDRRLDPRDAVQETVTGW